MNNLEPEIPLTEAARQALDSLTDEYRQIILNEAASRSMRIDGVRPEISVRDIIESAEKIAAPRSTGGDRKKDSIMQVYQILGLGFVFSGIVLMLKGEIPLKLDVSQQIAIIITMLGMLLILSPIFFRRFFSLLKGSRSTIDISSNIATRLFLERWQVIENLLRGHLASRGHGAAREPFSSLVLTLQDKGLLGNDDIIVLRRLLGLRNQVMHDRGYADKRGLNRAIELSDNLITKLKAMI
jgi:hypothetical protein